jgi:hypothetical protein
MKKADAIKLAKVAVWLCAGAVLNEVFSAVEQKASATPAAKPKPGAVRRAPASSNQQLSNYLVRLRGKLLRIWEPTDGKNTVVLEAVVDPSGAVSDLKTSNSRASDIAIQTATTAFEKVQPLEPLPTSAKSPGKLSITFTSAVDPHGDSTSNIMTRIDPLPVSASTQEAKTPAGGENTQSGSNK